NGQSVAKANEQLVRVCVRFRPINVMEKKHEVRLLFKTQVNFFVLPSSPPPLLTVFLKNKSRKYILIIPCIKVKYYPTNTQFDMDDKDFRKFIVNRKLLMQKNLKNELPKPLVQWTTEECCDWLHDIDMDPYKKRFRAKKVNGAYLLEIPDWQENKPLGLCSVYVYTQKIEPKRVVSFTRGDQSHVFELDTIIKNCSQSEAFDALGRPLVEDVINGYNTTIFAYGQTGRYLYTYV
ncbi:hypothetical protein RFI_13869, partial [Reticulomyxa filosa]